MKQTTSLPLSLARRLFGLSTLQAISIVAPILSACSTQAPGAAPAPEPVVSQAVRPEGVRAEPPTATPLASKPSARPATRAAGVGQSPAPDEANSLARSADAVPRHEALHPSANRPYVLRKRRYVPMTERKAFRQRGLASWYGRPFHGRKTATGERYDMRQITAAHPTLPLPSYARVRSLETGRSIVVRVNDRGPFVGDRVIDLSLAAAARLGFTDRGVAPVQVELIVPGPEAPGDEGLLAADPGQEPGPDGVRPALLATDERPRR
jgi:rare lipoprotein A